jgi:hypothetical protein
MNPSSLYRRTLSLLPAITLSLSCLLLIGCRLDLVLGHVNTKDVFGEHRDQFPTIALSSDNKEQIDYTFDWNTTTVGGVEVSKFNPGKKFWRMNIYRYSDGERIGDHRDYRAIENPAETFQNLPVEKYLRIDLDLADDQQGTKGTEYYSFMVLFHYEEPLPVPE